MNLNEKILYNDFDTITINSHLNLECLDNSSILITGATGLIGSLLVKYLLYYNYKNDKNIKIITLVRDIKKATEMFERYLNNKCLTILQNDIQNTISYNKKIDYIIHCASITDSKTMYKYPKKTWLTSFIGTKNVLDFAVSKKVKSFIYISSMEMYGQISSSSKVKENEIGYIDILSPRSSYSEGKRACESLNIAYMIEDNLPVKIIRLSQVFGAGVSYNDTRIYSQFAKSIINHKNIVLNTSGETVGNYCYTVDAILGVLFVLLYGENGEAYNVCNEENSMLIKDMASLVVENFGSGKLEVEIHNDNEQKIYAPINKMYLSSKKLESLGWFPSTNLNTMYLRLFQYWGYK
ncbi:NAD-dependent epimerase/dehydratase family protein [Candidatus Stoquefichus sp. SB1]|uniref:NAD-dependent epimerase/dehydratase family protein n=1 Tax=Candidatus Stoquefichus sp. SB1 TaxID=1658109 RepID=UPI00067F6B26|nr:NAD(P)-dependent oxidoreductase [Candidatus Stoquefichus sp. SB1]